MNKKSKKKQANGAGTPAIIKAMVVAAHMCGVSTACPAIFNPMNYMYTSFACNPSYACSAAQKHHHDSLSQWERSRFFGTCASFGETEIVPIPSTVNGGYYNICTGHDLNYQHSKEYRTLDLGSLCTKSC